MPQIYQRTLNGIDMTLEEFEDLKASIRSKLIDNDRFWRKLIQKNKERIW